MRGCKYTSRLSVISLALALGILKALSMLLFALYVSSTGHGAGLVTSIGEFYKGYAATGQGGLIGAGYGFVEGFICGLIFAWLYNFFLMCCRCCCKHEHYDEVERNIEITRKNDTTHL